MWWTTTVKANEVEPTVKVAAPSHDRRVCVSDGGPAGTKAQAAPSPFDLCMARKRVAGIRIPIKLNHVLGIHIGRRPGSRKSCHASPSPQEGGDPS